MNHIILLLAILSLTALPAQQSGNTQPLSRDSINLALVMGAEAIDLLKLAYRQLANKKAETDQLYGLVNNLTLETNTLTHYVETYKKKTFWQKIWAWIRGALVGAATMAIVIETTK